MVLSFNKELNSVCQLSFKCSLFLVIPMASPKLKAYKFISEPDSNLKCAVCLELASQPKQCEDCGKLFCSECIEKNGRKHCLSCWTHNPRYFDNTKSKQCT